jgi:hypothetical protein
MTGRAQSMAPGNAPVPDGAAALLDGVALGAAERTSLEALLGRALVEGAALPFERDDSTPLHLWSHALHAALVEARLAGPALLEVTRRATLATVQEMARRCYAHDERRLVRPDLEALLTAQPAALRTTLLEVHDRLESPRFMSEFMLGLWRDAAAAMGRPAGLAGEVSRKAILGVLFRRARALGLYQPGERASRPMTIPPLHPESKQPANVLNDLEFVFVIARGRLFFDFGLERVDHGPDPHVAQIIAVAQLVRERLAEHDSPLGDIFGVMRHMSQSAENMRMWLYVFDWGWTPGFTNPSVVTAHLRAMLPLGADRVRNEGRRAAAATRLSKR